jgi:1-acyl-sn-glycerol-3-phosphate acyltransferase
VVGFFIDALPLGTSISEGDIMTHRWEHRSTLRRWWRRSGERRRRWPRAVLVAVGGPLARRLFRLRIEGDEHLPATGPAILAANHLSFFDHIALILAARRRLSFVGKAEYLDSWKTRRVLPALGMIPLDRDNPRRALAALDQAAGVLRAEELFAIYPEGTRSRDGALHAGHSGVGHLSMATGVAVVPTGIVGTDRIQPPGARVPRPFKPAVVRFGAPIDPIAYQGTRRERRRRITTDVMHAIADLTGQTPDLDVAGHDPGVRGQPHHDRGDASVTGPGVSVGEMLDIDERVVVSPVAGVFTPLTPEGAHVEVGQRIGQVCTRSTVVPVCTPFTGQLVAMTAVEGERVDRCQRVAWLGPRP